MMATLGKFEDFMIAYDLSQQRREVVKAEGMGNKMWTKNSKDSDLGFASEQCSRMLGFWISGRSGLFVRPGAARSPRRALQHL